MSLRFVKVYIISESAAQEGKIKRSFKKLNIYVYSDQEIIF